jgi:hypothetical protein
VRQFETVRIRDRLLKSGGHASLSPRDAYGSLRFGIVEKAEQLRPLAAAGVPLLIVLANPLGADVMLDAHHMLAAMWGNPGYVVSIDASNGRPADGGQAHWRLEEYGAFASSVMKDDKVVGTQMRHPHITAVIVVHERLNSADWREEMMRRHPADDNSFEAATDAALKSARHIDAAVRRGEEPDGAYRWTTVYEVNGAEAVPLPADWFNSPRDERYGYTAGGYGRIWPDS